MLRSFVYRGKLFPANKFVRGEELVRLLPNKSSRLTVDYRVLFRSQLWLAPVPGQFESQLRQRKRVAQASPKTSHNGQKKKKFAIELTTQEHSKKDLTDRERITVSVIERD